MAVNMSYCRFANTLAALKECQDALSETSDPMAELSPGEAKAAKRLLALCDELAADYCDD